MKTIYLAGGCFWGVQKYMDQFDGIKETVVGYANGNTDSPVYEDVKAGKTGHAETVKVDYDESRISLEEILKKYYIVIDPTSLNKQGGDIGISYRTGIYYTDPEELEVINQVTDGIRAKNKKPVVVEIEELKNFWPAEEYHQKYLDKNPGGYCHIGACYFGK